EVEAGTVDGRAADAALGGRAHDAGRLDAPAPAEYVHPSAAEAEAVRGADILRVEGGRLQRAPAFPGQRAAQRLAISAVIYAAYAFFAGVSSWSCSHASSSTRVSSLSSPSLLVSAILLVSPSVAGEVSPQQAA